MTFIINPFVFAAPVSSGPTLPVSSGLQLDFDPNAFAGIDQAIMTGSWSNGAGVYEPRSQAGTYWQAPGTTHSCNSLATAYFDGFSYGAFFSAGPTLDGPVLTSFTMFCVLKIKNDGSDHCIFGGVSGAAEWIIKGSDNKQTATKRGTATLGSSSTALSTSAFKQIAVTYDGSTVQFYKDGATDGSASNSQTMTGKTQYIGNGSSGGYRYTARECVYNRVLNSTELSDTFAYLAGRYAVT